MKCFLPFVFALFPLISPAQSFSQKLQKAFQQFESDSQLKHAISSLYVIDAKTGQVVFDKNSQVGLVPASTQKIITAATAFELMGKDYRYKTEFWWNKSTPNYSKQQYIEIKQVGDPTFGSNRFSNTKSAEIVRKFAAACSTFKVPVSEIAISRYNNRFELQKIPDGWIFQDIGNYYGAGSAGFNWKENQADVILKAGKFIGDDVKIVSIDTLVGIGYVDNQLKTGKANSGDNAYYYFNYGNHSASYPIIKGTIPFGGNNFTISIAVANPFSYFVNELRKNQLISKGFANSNNYDISTIWQPTNSDINLFNHFSPTLDSIIYWFLKKSINLYGEALIKTFAYEKQGFGSTDSGVAVVKKFWKQKGIDEDELNISDGSGLSPQNRVTTHAQVEILKYAKTKDWFPYFYDALPDYNSMKMKSGTIRDVKGFCGYHKAKDGKEYIFSFLVNNYSGKTSGVVAKMYKVLDELKAP
jgi:serine-type D-Ala-D-Ala carboxypeptidase/endopeptidase (penicillin-binding protein 4)